MQTITPKNIKSYIEPILAENNLKLDEAVFNYKESDGISAKMIILIREPDVNTPIASITAQYQSRNIGLPVHVQCQHHQIPYTNTDVGAENFKLTERLHTVFKSMLLDEAVDKLKTDILETLEEIK